MCTTTSAPHVRLLGLLAVTLVALVIFIATSDVMMRESATDSAALEIQASTAALTATLSALETASPNVATPASVTFEPADPRCPLLSIEPPHIRPRLPGLVHTARVVNLTWQYGAKVRELVMRVAVGPPRIGVPSPPLESCSDRVRASLFSNELVIGAECTTLAYKYTTPGSAFDVLVKVVVPCDAPPSMRMQLTLEWENWVVSTQRYNASNAKDAPIINRLQTLGQHASWPVPKDANLLRDPNVTIPACPSSLAVPRPLCNSSLDLDIFAGAFRVPSEFAVVDDNTGTLKKHTLGVLHISTWLNGSEGVRWQPHTCNLDTDWSSAAIVDKLGPGLVVFLGDSTLEEIYITILERILEGSWHPRDNDRAAQRVGNYSVTDKREGRMFDRRFNHTRLRFMWSASPFPYVASEGSLGVSSFEHSMFQSQLEAFLSVDADIAQRCAGLKCAAPLVVFNSGLHDLVTNGFSFDAYERKLDLALRNMTARGVRLLVLSTSPKSQNYVRYVSERLGTPGVRVLNDIAKRVVQSIPGVVWADFAAPRALAPYEDDGVHCVTHYARYDKPWWRSYGISCVWRMRALVTAISRLNRIEL